MARSSWSGCVRDDHFMLLFFVDGNIMQERIYIVGSTIQLFDSGQNLSRVGSRDKICPESGHVGTKFVPTFVPTCPEVYILEEVSTVSTKSRKHFRSKKIESWK